MSALSDASRSGNTVTRSSSPKVGSSKPVKLAAAARHADPRRSATRAVWTLEVPESGDGTSWIPTISPRCGSAHGTTVRTSAAVVKQGPSAAGQVPPESTPRTLPV